MLIRLELSSPGSMLRDDQLYVVIVTVHAYIRCFLNRIFTIGTGILDNDRSPTHLTQIRSLHITIPPGHISIDQAC